MDRTLTASQSSALQQSFLIRVYNWMAAGLALTAVISFYLMANEALIVELATNQFKMWGLIIAELAVVFYLSARIQKMSTTSAMFAFFLYAGLNGLTLSPIFLLYTKSSISAAFFIAGGTFAATSFYGYVTKKDLSSIGSFLLMALVGAIIASLVNIFFLQSSGMDWLISLVIVFVAVGLTAYDTQILKRMSAGGLGDEETQTRAAIFGALKLYLDFILLFVHLLRLMGNRR